MHALAVARLARERVAALEQHDLGHVLGERQRLLHAGIAAADDDRDLVAQQRRVATRAQWLTPLPNRRSSPGTPSFASAVPVAMTAARATISPSALVTRQRSPSAATESAAAIHELDAGRSGLLLRHRAEIVAGTPSGKPGTPSIFSMLTS